MGTANAPSDSGDDQRNVPRHSGEIIICLPATGKTQKMLQQEQSYPGQGETLAGRTRSNPMVSIVANCTAPSAESTVSASSERQGPTVTQWDPDSLVPSPKLKEHC